MKRMTYSKIFLISFIVLFLCTGYSAGQEKFPTKPIDLYVGFPPGGTVGPQAQVLAEVLKKYLGQPVIINYKPGATQTIAADFVSKSKPDGYTIILMTVSDLLPKIIKDGQTLKFGLADFLPLGAASYSPAVLAVRSESPYKSLEELVAFGKKSPPGTLSFASTSTYGMSHLAGELFSMKTGVVLNHVPFQGGGPAQIAILGGHVDMLFGTLGLLSARLKPGAGMRPLAILDQKRLAEFPEVPTLIERGYDMTVQMWWALFAPKGLPEPVTASLAQAYEKAAKDPQLTSWLDKAGFIHFYLNPKEVEKKMYAELSMFEDIIKKVDSMKK